MTALEVLNDLYEHFPAMRTLIDSFRRGEVSESDTIKRINTDPALWGKAA